MSELVASGTVRVRNLRNREWDEFVEVFERDIDTENEQTVEDAARQQAITQSGAVETLEVELS